MKKELKEEKERRKTGLGNSLKTVRARIKKSRFGTEGRNAWMVLDSTYGLTRYSGLFQLLCDFGVCVKNGTRYSVPGVITNDKGEDISFYKKEFIEVFREKEEKYIIDKNEDIEIEQKDVSSKIEENDENIEKVLKANIKQKRRNRIEYFDLHPEIPLDERNNYHIDNNNFLYLLILFLQRQDMG